MSLKHCPKAIQISAPQEPAADFLRHFCCLSLCPFNPQLPALRCAWTCLVPRWVLKQFFFALIFNWYFRAMMLTYSLEENNWRNKCRNVTLFAPLEGIRSQAEYYKWMLPSRWTCLIIKKWSIQKSLDLRWLFLRVHRAASLIVFWRRMSFVIKSLVRFSLICKASFPISRSSTICY